MPDAFAAAPSPSEAFPPASRYVAEAVDLVIDRLRAMRDAGHLPTGPAGSYRHQSVQVSTGSPDGPSGDREHWELVVPQRCDCYAGSPGVVVSADDNRVAAVGVAAVVIEAYDAANPHCRSAAAMCPATHAGLLQKLSTGASAAFFSCPCRSAAIVPLSPARRTSSCCPGDR